MPEIRKINGEDFTIERDPNDSCVVLVINGSDTARACYHETTRRFRGEFDGWGSDASSLDDAINTAAQFLLRARRGISREDACKAIDNLFNKENN